MEDPDLGLHCLSGPFSSQLVLNFAFFVQALKKHISFENRKRKVFEILKHFAYSADCSNYTYKLCFVQNMENRILDNDTYETDTYLK